MTQLSIAAAGPEPTPELAQWFTPPLLAEYLVGLAGKLLDDATHRGVCLRVLEPSAGRGNLVRAVQARAPGALIDAVELDPRWCAELRVLGGCRVSGGDYLTRPAPARRYDLGVCNVPFDGGEEADHLEKLLDETERLVGLLPARSLHGRDRFRRVWSRVGQQHEWSLRQLVHMVLRPAFGAKGGSDEIVLFDLRRGVPGPCDVRWL